ncbi:heat shock protein Hsp [Mycobacterium tuberculosis]|nr:heat shock protein Hsp [Mycobacterium tuberculosis]
MNNLALWSRPVWDVEPWDRWLRDFFGPAATTDWYRPVAGDFTPAAEIVKDGDDAVVRLELPGIDVDKDVNVELAPGQPVSRLVTAANTATSTRKTPETKTAAPCVRSATDHSAARSGCPRTSPARPSRLPMTPVC